VSAALIPTGRQVCRFGSCLVAVRSPAAIVSWMNDEELERWVREAPTKEAYRRRLAIWWTACRGLYATDIATLLHASQRTVRWWIHQYNQSGPDALEMTNWGGRRWSYLPETEERAVLSGLRPRARKGRLVTVDEMRDTVEKHVEHPVSETYLLGLLHRHGWRKIEPRPQHVKSNPAAQEAYKREFPTRVRSLIAGAPKHLRPCVLFADEAHFGRISTLRACWAPPDMRPIVRHQRVRQFCDALVAVDPWEGRLSAFVMTGGVDHEVMSWFLSETKLRFTERYCILFLNGAGAHISEDLVVPQDMRLELLPPYSPELNPVEPLWDYLREHYFGNRVFPAMQQVRARLYEALRDLDVNPQLVQSITSFDWIKAANLTAG
jgi:transposase